jgi:hypothetical protein
LTTALVAAVAGLLGIALGAWLNSLFATAKERWEFKRELYCRLLEHLYEASAVLRMLVKTPAELDKLNAFNAEVEQIRRAHAVAALFLDRETNRAIEELDAAWKGFREVPSEHLDDSFKQRVDLLSSTYQAVLRVARGDLSLKGGA